MRRENRKNKRRNKKQKEKQKGCKIPKGIYSQTNGCTDLQTHCIFADREIEEE